MIIMQADSECKTGDSGSYCFLLFSFCENEEKKQQEETSR